MSQGYVDQLCQRLEQVVLAVTRCRDCVRSPSRRQRSTSRRPANGSSGKERSSGLCYYHCRFGPDARRRRKTPSGRPLEATSGPSLRESRLFYVTDRATGNRLLVDKGAEVSAIPVTDADRSRRPISFLQALNGFSDPIYAECSLSLNLGLRQTFRWIFLVADVGQAILGADFL